jgi:SAM-dependent methyltransferase
VETALRSRFDEVYSNNVIGAGFFESDEYYRLERERYWKSLNILRGLNFPDKGKMLEIGGGQMAVLCKRLFGNDCVVGDVSNTYRAPLQRQQIPFIECNLMREDICDSNEQFDLVLLLEVIEHIPLPAYVIFERIRRILKPNGILFLTTPNLFRLRNLFRMFFGIELFDRFLLPQPGQALGHQLEYSADHLKWQVERAGMQIISLKHDELGHIGHSAKARFARKCLAPLRMRPLWRDELVVVAKDNR